MIGHIDADCFYVSCERIRYPALKGKPVGVLGNQGACVIAKSYEARDRGVKTGVPIWEAVAICPEMIFVKRDFRWYEVVSQRLLAETRKFSERVEYYSIDEMFFDARKVRDEGALRRMRDAIEEKLGVPVTIGVAPSKMLAKLVSDTSKPHGCGVKSDPAEIEALLGRLSVREITGVAGRRAARLEAHGIRTCLDFVRADPGLIRRTLTVVGEKLWLELNGSTAFPLQLERPLHKCISRGGEHLAGDAGSDGGVGVGGAQSGADGDGVGSLSAFDAAAGNRDGAADGRRVVGQRDVSGGDGELRGIAGGGAGDLRATRTACPRGEDASGGGSVVSAVAASEIAFRGGGSPTGASGGGEAGDQRADSAVRFTERRDAAAAGGSPGRCERIRHLRYPGKDVFLRWKEKREARGRCATGLP